MMRRGAALALLVFLLQGCAALRGTPAAPSAAPSTADAAASAASAPAAIEVHIDAPPRLATLLQAHLDLIRLSRLERGDVDDSEWSRLIDTAPAQARALLETEGYFSSHVTVERRGGGNRSVDLHVDPGPRARVTAVTIEVQGALDADAAAGDAHARATLEQLRERWPLPVGADFRNPAWSAAKAEALARLHAAGYANAVWSGTDASVDAATNEVRIYGVVDSGPLYRLGELQIEGLAEQDLATVENLALARRGAPVTEASMAEFQERLQKSGLFDQISVTLDPDPEQAARARVIVRLREAAMQSYTVGVGVSANTGPRASLNHVYRRLFGTPATLSDRIEYGKLHKLWNSEIAGHPGPDLYHRLLGVTVEQLISSTDAVLSQRLRLGRSQEGERIDRQFYVETERSLRHTNDNVINTKAIATSLNFAGIWRDLDSIVLPTRGYTLSTQLGVGHAHGDNASSGPYARAYARLTGYLPLGGDWHGQGRVEYGQVYMRHDMIVPESQLFRAGGDDSVRGYDYRGLGPIVDGSVDGGNVIATTSLELARPISASLPSVWGAVFVDAGNVANSVAELHPVVGVGIGVRWRSPAGPLRIDWGYGLKTRSSHINFSVGIAF
ncbi:MAG: BamA/TamA family outer membrane protein [Burkholderiales bacterium]|nr:BamA/TamA family outer membrane protein [Burkholderiales bacterium]